MFKEYTKCVTNVYTKKKKQKIESYWLFNARSRIQQKQSQNYIRSKTKQRRKATFFHIFFLLLFCLFCLLN
jgi:hypothetical protein